jgi:ATP-dependent exoDNAse (exonuclease V) alpha subunit
MLTLELKVGSRIMLIKNIDTAAGLINGSMGKILQLYKTEIKILFDNGKTANIPKNEWKLQIDDCIVRFKQFPLVCSYSITIHKSISLSLDYTVCDLSRCFCHHLVYLALSRVTSLDKVLLKSFNPTKITVNPKILTYLGLN